MVREDPPSSRPNTSHQRSRKPQVGEYSPIHVGRLRWSGVKQDADVATTEHEGLHDELPTRVVDDDSTPKPLLLTVEQAAEILTIGRSTIYQLIWNAELAPIRIGRSVRFTVNQLEEFVNRRQAEVSR